VQERDKYSELRREDLEEVCFLYLYQKKIILLEMFSLKSVSVSQYVQHGKSCERTVGESDRSLVICIVTRFVRKDRNKVRVRKSSVRMIDLAVPLHAKQVLTECRHIALPILDLGALEGNRWLAPLSGCTPGK
jgi:hypothetical protein